MNIYDLIDEENKENYVPKHATHNVNNDKKDLSNDTGMLNNKESKEIENNFQDKEKNYEEEINLYEENIHKQTSRKNKRKYNKRRILKAIIFVIILIVLIIIMIYSIFKIFNWILDNKKTSDITKQIEDKIKILESPDNENTMSINEEEDENNPYWYYIKFPLINVDITKLKKENPDTVGWINVNNTKVNYPFVQSKDNDFYLNHSFDKSYNEAGWLFLDYRNSSNLSDKNSIIYAHSRLDQTMFGSLSKVLKESWYNNKDNHIIRMSLESENTMWQIFSVYKIKTETYYLTTNFNTSNEYLDFLNTIKNRSLYDFNVNLNEEDKILTLSTCYSDTERTVVHSRLIKKSIKD